MRYNKDTIGKRQKRLIILLLIILGMCVGISAIIIMDDYENLNKTQGIIEDETNH